MNNRNVICWCGLDKKYKKCHLNLDIAHHEAIGMNNYYDRKDKNYPRNSAYVSTLSVLATAGVLR